MPVSQQHVAALRAVLDGEQEAFARLTAPADFFDGEGFPILIATTFVMAAQMRFPPGWTFGDVVRFVGHLRARNEGAGADLSATAAEQMLFSALSQKPMVREFNEISKGVAQVALLIELVKDLTEQELNKLLAEASDQASAWLAKNNVL